MTKYSNDDILKIVHDKKIEFLRLHFTDIFGKLKFDLPDLEREKLGIETLPKNLMEAINEMENDEVIKKSSENIFLKNTTKEKFLNGKTILQKFLGGSWNNIL